jgi:hypothetical protein
VAASLPQRLYSPKTERKKLLKMKKKPNLTKLIKAIVFIAISVMFLTVTFYSIKTSVIIDGYEITIQRMFDTPNGATRFFGEFFKPLIANYIFSVLFALLGILEIKEAFSNGN